MMIRNSLAKAIPARWFSIACVLLGVAIAPAWQVAKSPARKNPPKSATPPPARKSVAKAPSKSSQKTAQANPVARPISGGALANLVRECREAPSPQHRAAVEAYAASHPSEAPLARFALGVAAFESGDFLSAVSTLSRAEGKLPRLADYVGYYLAAARVEYGGSAAAAQSLASVRTVDVPSPLAAKSWLVEARAVLKERPAQAVRLLQDHYHELPQPEGDLTLGEAAQAAGNLLLAVDAYQRIYASHVSGDAASRAAAGLVTLRDAMGGSFPPNPPALQLRRADRLMDAREYRRARVEYETIAGALTGIEGEQARVRAGNARLQEGNAASAATYLRNLELDYPDADAERLYLLTECARRVNDDAALMSAIGRLEKYRQSLWRLRALLSAANRFLLVNNVDAFLPLYQSVADDFPRESAAALADWKVTFQAYLSGSGNAVDRLREHLRRFPTHATSGAALYFLGRSAERSADYASARACYQRLAAALPNHYYAILARDRLKDREVAAAPVTGETARFVAELTLSQSRPLPSEPVRATVFRTERARLLRSAGLDNLADAELRFGARTDGQPALLAMEMAAEAEAPHAAVRAMKSLSPDYLSFTMDQAPRRFWEFLFPLPWRWQIESAAHREGIDPFLLAGLIRQESEFNPGAVSGAKAYGLTQVRPGTGREIARRAGVSRVTTRTLLDPAVNLKLGAGILRSMLDRNEGNVEQTLASYNAGPARLASWLAWRTYREPAEFIESVPFTETRDYIQAVLRNADFYRRLYR
jgi:soluble lytic murein transglycosylase